jgi:hypothetical protein
LSETVCHVYMSPSTQSTWGEDWLEPNEVIFPTAHRDFSIPAGQAYDFKVEDCDHNTLGEVYGVQVTGQGYTWTLSP